MVAHQKVEYNPFRIGTKICLKCFLPLRGTNSKIYWFNTLKSAAEAPTADLLRLSILRGTKTVFLIPKKVQAPPYFLCRRLITAPFNNMRTLQFKSQRTNAFFATVNQMFGGSSQLPTTAKRAVIKSNRLDNIVGSWEELPNS